MQRMPKRKQLTLIDKNKFSSPSGEAVGRLKILARKLLAELDAVEYQQLSETSQLDFYEEVKRFEIRLISEALHHSEGHQIRAARLINLNPTTLNNKIKQYDIKVNTFSKDVDVQKNGRASAFRTVKERSSQSG